MRQEYLQTIVQLALAEDTGCGDITTNNLVSSTAKAKARLVAKADGIICGLPLAREVFKSLDANIKFRAVVKDGEPVRCGQILAEISGLSRALLSGERVALNFLTSLSGIATQTRAFVQQVRPYQSKIMDTRKTTPLLRQLERYAVRTGGGENHRFNLNDMAMIKDNHLIVCGCGSLANTVDYLSRAVKAKIEVEVDTLDQFKAILYSKADIILLDNMTPARIAKAVALRNQAKRRILLEASGGINLKNVRQYAATGVDRISIGALTHSRQALDISMEFLNP